MKTRFESWLPSAVSPVPGPAERDHGYNPSHMSPEDETARDLAAHWRRFVAAGILAMLVGAVAILVPPLATVAIEIFIGWVLIVAGGFLVANAFSFTRLWQVAVRLVWAALTVAAGIYLLAAPLEGTITLTVALAAFFIALGLVRLATAIAERGTPGAGLAGLSGALGLLVGVLIAVELPSSAAWAIGLLVGIDLLFFGWTLLAVGLSGRELARPHT